MNKEHRQWGYFEVLDVSADGKVKTKKLVVYPHKSLSLQKHKKRNELWFVAEGYPEVYTMRSDYRTDDADHVEGERNFRGKFVPNERLIVVTDEWHQLVNPTDEDVVVIEIQYGEACEEDDILRATKLVSNES